MAGEIGNAFGKAAGEAITVSTKALSAIVVGTSAGEAFRNAIMRGADPRIAVDNDKQIADNTGRAAAGIEALPGDLGNVISGQLAKAAITV